MTGLLYQLGGRRCPHLSADGLRSVLALHAALRYELNAS